MVCFTNFLFSHVFVDVEKGGVHMLEQRESTIGSLGF